MLIMRCNEPGHRVPVAIHVHGKQTRLARPSPAIVTSRHYTHLLWQVNHCPIFGPAVYYL